MVFNRKDYGMNKGIPFISIADHVDVQFHLKEKQVSGPPQARTKSQPSRSAVGSSILSMQHNVDTLIWG